MTSVDRIHRLLQVVELLQSGRVYNTSQLAQECGVSRRTIFRDLTTLQDSGVRVEYDEHRQGYFLPARMFIVPTDFSLDEALSLLVLCHELGDAQRGLPFQRAARSAALKLLSSLPTQLGESLGKLSAVIRVQLDPHNRLDGAQPYYERLTQALQSRQQVRIGYQSLAEWKNISTVLSPYRIVFHRRSWYAIGRSSLHRSVRTFNVGRIKKLDMLDSHYDIPPRFNLDRHLGNAWSLIRERGRRYDVAIRFQKTVAYNVAEVHWHKTQRVVWNDDESIDFHVTVDGLNEIQWWILGYGDHAEVLEPPELREMIQSRVASMHKMYKKRRKFRTKHNDARGNGENRPKRGVR